MTQMSETHGGSRHGALSSELPLTRNGARSWSSPTVCAGARRRRPHRAASTRLDECTSYVNPHQGPAKRGYRMALRDYGDGAVRLAVVAVGEIINAMNWRGNDSAQR